MARITIDARARAAAEAAHLGYEFSDHVLCRPVEAIKFSTSLVDLIATKGDLAKVREQLDQALHLAADDSNALPWVRRRVAKVEELLGLPHSIETAEAIAAFRSTDDGWEVYCARVRQGVKAEAA